MRRANLSVGSVALGLLIASLAGCSSDIKPEEPQHLPGTPVEQLYIVDCLLPNSVRQLGTHITYLAPRRAIKTSAVDCAQRGGEYVAYNRANYQSALQAWLPAAEQGDSHAQVTVGEIYERGLGAKPDYQQAKQWYQRAAQQGNTRAKMNLAVLYEHGLGGERNRVKALNLYRASAGLADSVEFVSPAQRLQRADQQRKLTQVEQALQATQQQLSQLQAQRQALSTALAQAHQQASIVAPTPHSVRERVVVDPQQAQQITALRQEIATLNNTIQTLQQTEKSVEVKLLPAPADVQLQTENDRLRRELKQVKQQLKQQKRRLRQTQTRLQQLEESSPLPNKAIDQPRQDTTLQQQVAVKEAEIKATEAKQEALLRSLNSDLNSTKLLATETAIASSLGTYHALVIGNNAYQQLPPLQTARADAQAVAKVLQERYGFQTTVLEDANRVRILAALESYRRRLTSHDNLLVYYAGHGQLQGGEGFWLPIDAKPSDKTTWISTAQVTNFIDAMPAKHILIVADSCYSGVLAQASSFPMQTGTKDADWFKALAKTKVRLVLSSGGLKPVLDVGSGKHSIFATAFLKSLNSDEALQEGASIYQGLVEQVQSSAKTKGFEQRPSYAPIRFAGHEAGDFIFQQQTRALAQRE